MTEKQINNNVREWVKNNLEYFPSNMTIEEYDLLPRRTKLTILTKLVSLYNKRHPKNYKNMWSSSFKLTPRELKSIKVSDELFPPSTVKMIEKNLATMRKKTDLLKPIMWTDINLKFRKSFRLWVKKYASKIEPEFKVEYFDNLSDDIKLDMITTVAKQFGLNTPGAVKDGYINSADLIKGVKKVSFNNKVIDAVLDIIPESKLLHTIPRKEMENWDASTSTLYAKSLAREEIQANRENRKVEKSE